MEKERYFYKFIEVKSKEIVSLIGFVQLVIDVCLRELIEYFSWNQKFCVSDVVKYFRIVIVDYKRDEKLYYVLMVKEIYFFLSFVDYVDVMNVLQGIEIFSWIWNGDGFFFFKVVLLEKFFIDLLFYICVFFLEMVQFFEFFFMFGMQK